MSLDGRVNLSLSSEEKRLSASSTVTYVTLAPTSLQDV